ncbi:WGxxGxxG family protein [Caldalkalibacillus salinus]|uniref:WGxxGxxG family protein n=1 Tax=Caldalkalibacillus salinus TaxID=2803787 RepID=UPI001F286EA5|nr:WGxxGxxG family protein [Caldalkalibacillus salinus]
MKQKLIILLCVSLIAVTTMGASGFAQTNTNTNTNTNTENMRMNDTTTNPHMRDNAPMNTYDNTTTTTRADDDDTDWGWLGLVGLAGLLAFRKRDNDQNK